MRYADLKFDNPDLNKLAEVVESDLREVRRQSFGIGLLVGAIGMLIFLSVFGCRAAMPVTLKTPIASTTKETTITQDDSPGATGGDKLTLTGGTGTDSISLWLAIAALGAAVVLPVLCSTVAGMVATHEGAKRYRDVLRPKRLAEMAETVMVAKKS